MVRRAALMVALAGLVVMLSRVAASAGPVARCFLCSCEDDETTPVTACFSSDPGENCPACAPGSKTLVEVVLEPCNVRPECLALLPVPAPALSAVPLAGVALSLLGGGIWLTRKRARPAS